MKILEQQTKIPFFKLRLILIKVFYFIDIEKTKIYITNLIIFYLKVN